MAKVTITFEGENWDDVQRALVLAGNEILKIKASSAPSEAEPDQAPIPAEPKKATRARPSATKAPEPSLPEPEEIELPIPATAAERAMPALEVLKQAVTVAVRAAQKNGGPKKILELLPDFKQNTNVDFIMNCREEHRAALYNLVQAAGLDV
jgi:hypothetical protein